MAADSNSARSNAHLYISQSRFHQRFTLPATADHESLTISYADVGQATNQNSPDPHTPTILFIPGMFASRYFGIYLHAIGEKLGVRILIVDR